MTTHTTATLPWAARSMPRLRTERVRDVEAQAARLEDLERLRWRAGVAPVPAGRTTAADTTAQASALADAELFWVTGDMARLALDASTDVPDWDAGQLIARSSKEIREAWNAALEEMDWTAVEDDVMAEHELEELDGEICAEIVEINRENVSFQDGDWRTAKTTFTDMVEITRGGVRVTEIEVTSSEDEEPYNEAVARIVGELPFTWVANSH